MFYLLAKSSDPSKLVFTDVLIVALLMLGVALIFGLLIMFVSKKFAVKVDEREEEVAGCLAGANCGGCGRAGCSALAKALIDGSAKIDDCPVTPKEQKLKIAEILGVDYSGGGSSKVVVMCCGGNDAVDRNEFVGVSDCVHRNMIVGGTKLCSNGCIGAGTCGIQCPVDAIVVKDGVAVINQSKCIKCGACIRSCPKHIIGKIPGEAKVYVACSSKCRGKEVMDACKVGCIGCGLCAKNCPNGAITMIDNLPVFDYSKCTGCGICVEKCPKKVIKTI